MKEREGERKEKELKEGILNPEKERKRDEMN